ncbi:MULTISPECIES: hypothetical protein [unclassified Streptomyces]|uniref:hypothetical protein n=1 Tax=unclassified Streptomyces TaxID=2593676 RepID=UPI00136D1F8A|nr:MULTISPECIES: hypothetical protein [unclassified Streptomyces]NEA01507.1 hypothetical protein [Streptomyces sp. SID10116]MYY87044.1 hypothetical protein [Streptomyces sp. SID335]MYZ13527.1 hypothetical protein [Streptomyces sp. SID337]NDZ89535.1 hypothetical protein [Streptomyces sp. SID10115]NEB49688.1 hypothetical protein [Streptomyces sp. SID339]
MLETYLSWYREGRMDESAFRSVTDHLARSGLTVEHPVLGGGTLLDVVGEQVKLPVGRILELVGLSLGPLCMQFWLSADTDVVCDVRYVAPDTQVLTFVLGGFTEGEREQATDAVQRLILRELDRTVALLVDPGGETPDEDADALVLYGRLPTGPRPDRVQFRTDRLSTIPTVLAGAEVTDLGNGLSTVRW